MRIERFDPVADGTRLAACHELWQTAQRNDDPAGAPMSLPGFTGWWGTGFTGEPRQVWLAAGDTGPVGCYLLELPHRENTSLGTTVLVVAPGERRRGLGSELLAHCCAQAGQDGRTRLTAETLEGAPGDAFARAAGGRAGLTEVRRILPVDDALPARLDVAGNGRGGVVSHAQMVAPPGPPALALRVTVRLPAGMITSRNHPSLIYRNHPFYRNHPSLI